MKITQTRELSVAPHHPEIVSSTDAARVIVLNLPAGERLQQHEVHERAWLLVVEGQVEVVAGDQSESGGPGLLAEFDPRESHEVRAVEDARLVLTLAPWPGEGHPGAMSLDDKAHAREHAREHRA
jgi:quercetin dioxygenase-like cupin family protein